MNTNRWPVLALLVILVTACAPAVTTQSAGIQMEGTIQPVETSQPAEVEINVDWVPQGHVIAVLEQQPDDYYTVKTLFAAGDAQYQYMPCESEGCVPKSIRYGIEKLGGCLAVASGNGEVLADLDECGAYFGGVESSDTITMPIPWIIAIVPGQDFYTTSEFIYGQYVDPTFTGYWLASPDAEGWFVSEYIEDGVFVLRWEYQQNERIMTVVSEERFEPSVCYIVNGDEFMFTIMPTDKPNVYIYTIGPCPDV